MPAIAASNGLRSISVIMRDARGFRLLARALLEIAPFLAHESARPQGGLAKNLLVFGRQARPGLLRHDQHFRAHRVFGQGVEAGVLVMIRGDEGRPVVFGAVDQPGGEPGQHLPVGQFDRLRAERADHRGHLLGLLHPNPQPLEVGHRGDRADVVVDRAGAGIVERQADEPIGLETAEDFSRRSVHPAPSANARPSGTETASPAHSLPGPWSRSMRRWYD